MKMKTNVKQQTQKAVRPPPTLEEMQARLEQHHLRVIADLEEMVKCGTLEREKVARRITKEPVEDSVGELAYVMAWGHGVREDCKAVCAIQLLSALRHSNEQMIDVLDRAALTHRHNANMRYRGTSSSAFSNAVDAVQRDVAVEFAAWCEVRREFLVQQIAEMTLL